MDTGAHGATILIVDDDPDLIEVLDLALTDAGYRVVAAPAATAVRVAGRIPGSAPVAGDPRCCGAVRCGATADAISARPTASLCPSRDLKAVACCLGGNHLTLLGRSVA